MTECETMRDRMPAVAHGAATWTHAESAHIAACAECAAAWRVVQAGVVLHADLAVDADRIADRVLALLREAPAEPIAVRRLPWRGAALGLLAAAASVVLVLSAPTLRHGAAGVDTLNTIALLPELQSLDDRQLESILQSLGPVAGDAAPGLVPHLEDLTDNELEQLLRSGGGE